MAQATIERAKVQQINSVSGLKTCWQLARSQAMASRNGCWVQLADPRESLKLLRTDHVDCIHIHNIARDDRYPAKRLGLATHIGCTAHPRPSRALPVFATGEIELFMASLNFVERHIYNFEEKVLPEARKRGIGVIAMKVLGGPGKGGGALLGERANYEATPR